MKKVTRPPAPKRGPNGGGMGPSKKLKINTQPSLPLSIFQSSTAIPPQLEPFTTTPKPTIATTTTPRATIAPPPQLEPSRPLKPKKAIGNPPPVGNPPKPPVVGTSSDALVKKVETTLPTDKVISLLTRFFSRPHLELEAKLGKWNEEGHFVSGVSQKDFQRFHDMLYSYKGWTNGDQIADWVSMFDYMLPDQVRCTKTSKGNLFIRKSLLEHVTFQCDGQPYDIRFSLKEEAPTEVRVPGVPTMVRVKKRKSFVYKRKFQFDLTMVWTGKDEHEAQKREPTFEVELECLDKRALGSDHFYTATSMMEKMLDFLNREKPISLSYVSQSKK